MDSSDKRPSTMVNESAKNPNGQRDTMAACPCDGFTPPNSDMHSTVNKAVDPTSHIGAKSKTSGV
jgi:hypothetical protein